MDADESTEQYREIRALLERLVASWPWDRPGTAFEDAKIYLDFHCADCGTKLSVNDLAVVLELEMLRLGTVDAAKVPFYDPICVRCYIRRAAPECRPAEPVVNRASGMELRRPHHGCARAHPMLLASADPAHVLAFQSATGATEGHPAPLSSSPLQPLIQDTMSSRSPQFRCAWRWRHAGEWLLASAVLLIALALGIALLSLPRQVHTSTLTRPTAPAEPLTATPALQPGSQSFHVGTGHAFAVSDAAGALSNTQAA